MVGSTRTPHQRWCRRPNAPSPRSFASRFAAARSCGVSSRRVRGSQQTFCHAWLELARCRASISDPDRFGMWELSSFQSVVHTPPSRGGDLLVAHLQPAVHGNDSRPSTLPTTERACLHPGTWVLYSSMSLELDATRSNYCVPPMTFRPDAEPPTHPHGMKDVPQLGYCVSVFPPSYGCVFLMHTSRHPSKRRHI